MAEMVSSQVDIADSSLPDRISDLPSNIIDCIFDRIPIRDVIATSILCKEWRHKWRRIPNLVFDRKFVDDVICRRTRGRGEHAMMELEYSCIIGKILLLHLGPIHKFVLHIPNFCNGKSPLDLSSWMLFISQNEVKELIIEDKQYTPKFRLPLYVFQCNELQHLKLDARELKLHPPQDFRGFCNLLSLDLVGLLDGGEISNLISKCPLLERLSIQLLHYGLPVVIDAPRLRFLYARIFVKTSLELKNVRSVTVISLEFGIRPSKFKFTRLINIFNMVPNVETVTLRLRPLHKIADVPQDPLTSIRTTLHNHKNLTLLGIDISSKASICFILCILRSSPNLRTLNLERSQSVSLIYPSATNVDEAALHSLDVLIREPLALNCLLTVKIKGLLGSEVEIMFIKQILSCSPVLEFLHLAGEKDIPNEAELTMISEILQCPRPSCRAQVIYSKYPGDSSTFDF